jgi:hypothetical protein
MELKILGKKYIRDANEYRNKLVGKIVTINNGVVGFAIERCGGSTSVLSYFTIDEFVEQFNAL